MEAGMIKREKERERIERQKNERERKERGVYFCGKQRGRHGIYTSCHHASTRGGSDQERERERE